MKVLLFLLLFVTFTFSQENLTDFCTLELFIGVQGLSETQYQGDNYPEMVQFVMERIDSQENLFYPPREAYNSTINNTPLDENPNQTWFGFNISGNNCGPNSNDNQVIQPAGTLMEQYSHGLYRVYANIYVDYGGAMMFLEERGDFFIDFRDLEYTQYIPPVNGHNTDLWLMYDGQSEPHFYYSNEAPPLDDKDQNGEYEEAFDDPEWVGIQDYEYLNIWKLKKNVNGSYNNSYPLTNFNIWQNGLYFITQNSVNPRIVWAAFPSNIPDYYKIYRGLPNPIKPTIFNYSLIATVNNDVFEYVDHDIFLNPNGDEVRYYVKAVVDGSESSPSNTVSTNGGFYKESTPPRSIS